MDYTLADLVAMSARSRPDHIAAVELGDPDRTFTYRQLWQRVGDLADALRHTPAGPHGPMVATLLPNSLDALASYLACQVAGVGAVPVNTRLADQEIAHILTDSGAGAVLAAGECLATARRVAGGTEVIDAAAIQPSGRFRDLTADASRGRRTAVVFYTSGTTGLPKGAAFHNDSWVVNTMRWGWQLGVRADEVMLVPGPLFHMSYSSFALATWLMGGQVRIMPNFSAERACDEFATSATFAFLVPSMTLMLLEEWKRRGRKPLTAMRSMMTSGAAVSPDLLAEAFEMFPNAEIQEVYGWTEAGFATREAKRPDTVASGTVGHATVGSDVAVFDEAGRPCAPRERGEIAVRTLCCSAGYLNPATAGTTRRGEWVLSGDIGYFTEDGRLRVVDRKHGMIISGGENVYAAEVEQVVLRHPAVRECVVVGQPDERWGEAVVAVAVLHPGKTLDSAQLRAFCKQHLADYKSPRRLVVVDELPRNSMGKLQRFLVRDMVVGSRE